MKVHQYDKVDFTTEPWASYLWGAPGDVDLDRDIDHLIEQLADDMKLEGTLTVQAYLRRKVDHGEIERVAWLALDELYDRLEEEYGNPDAFVERQDPEAEYVAATVEWVEKIVAGFEVWMCDETEVGIEVDVRKWAEKHAPHWLEGGE